MRFRVCVLVLVYCCRSASAATLHVDTFDATTQGWAGGSAPTRIAGGGPGGAGDPFLRISSVGNNLAVFNIDSPWIGNLTAVGATRVDVDLMSPSTSPSLSMRLVLFGPSSTDDRWTSATASFIPNDGVWRPYSFALSDLVSVQGTGTFAEVMANTLRVMLRHDTGDPSADGTPVIGSLGIDNIELAGVPEPASGALVATAAACWALARRRAG